MSEPRELTKEECRDRLLGHFSVMIDYWLHESRAGTVRDKMSGLVFSILAALDGSSAALPAFRILTRPHSDDRDYCKQIGENWWPDLEVLGNLHEFWHRIDAPRSAAARGDSDAPV